MAPIDFSNEIIWYQWLVPKFLTRKKVSIPLTSAYMNEKFQYSSESIVSQCNSGPALKDLGKNSNLDTLISSLDSRQAASWRMAPSLFPSCFSDAVEGVRH